MERAKRVARTLLRPPVWVLLLVSFLSFGALAAVFLRRSTKEPLNKSSSAGCRVFFPIRAVLKAGNTYSIPPLSELSSETKSLATSSCRFHQRFPKNAPACLIYGMSAYSLAVWVIAAPGVTKRIKSAMMKQRLVRRVTSCAFAAHYHSDLSYRGGVSLYQGMTFNFLYVAFRLVTGIRYASVWFLSIAVYHLVLGALRLYLIVGYRHRSPARERRCYCMTARLLFLLNLPMGGMIAQMIWKNSGFSYPGYIIYLSALYTFYTMVTAAVNLVKFRRLGSPILSAAKVLNFAAALMSMLGLQTAMIARFSENDENFSKMMNVATGSVAYGIVIMLAIYMLLRSRKLNRRRRSDESS